jgi:malonate-semialdehyde dehydrogenase (acetylating)/methylmalonate-semialdehyde dehydrogenase
VLVPVGDAYQGVREKFVTAARALRVGNGLQEGIQMGPVVSKKHKEKVLGYIEKGIQEGAKLILDGRTIKVEGHANGFYIGPTIFDEVHPDMTIAKEEIFGPVVSIVRVKTLEEGLTLIENNEYGNAACLYTTSGKTAREFKYRAVASMMGINLGIAAPMSFFPFGGAKGSFFGDIKGHGREVFQFFTDSKVVIQRWT